MPKPAAVAAELLNLVQLYSQGRSRSCWLLLRWLATMALRWPRGHHGGLRP
eukprot:COSAG03_NODE_26801_length_257_cov_0.512658_1_plen_50_part_01